jgi:hypothetical protein
MMVQKSLYEELEQICCHLHTYHMIILLGDVNAKVGRENIFKPTTKNESLHQNSSDDDVRIINFTT